MLNFCVAFLVCFHKVKINVRNFRNVVNVQKIPVFYRYLSTKEMKQQKRTILGINFFKIKENFVHFFLHFPHIFGHYLIQPFSQFDMFLVGGKKMLCKLSESI